MEGHDFKTLIIRKKRKKILIAVLAIIFIIAVAMVIYPFLPLLKYNFSVKSDKILPGEAEEIAVIQEEPEDIASISAVDNNQEVKDNVLIIPKIGVRIPIAEGSDESALNKGAWRLPETSTPDKGGNIALAGHRWKYRPPSEKTFYLLDKLIVGDTLKISWKGKDYNYKVVSIFVVEPTEVWVLSKTEKTTVTLITCTPLFSTEKRLIVRGELIE
jgi:LPXTG-site transpeptidase (sortase) family protein